MFIAAKHLNPVKVQLDGPFDKALQSYIEDTGPHIVALQLKPDKNAVPIEVINLMRCSKAAVLLYRDRALMMKGFKN
jgi:hypothetical protein